MCVGARGCDCSRICVRMCLSGCARVSMRLGVCERVCLRVYHGPTISGFLCFVSFRSLISRCSVRFWCLSCVCLRSPALLPWHPTTIGTGKGQSANKVCVCVEVRVRVLVGQGSRCRTAVDDQADACHRCGGSERSHLLHVTVIEGGMRIGEFF